jgi:hypothetical protein
MNLRSWVLVGVAMLTACESDVERRNRQRQSRRGDSADTVLPRDQRVAFVPPPSWEPVQLPSGVAFRQPPQFTIVNAPTITCDQSTPPDSAPVLNTQLSDRWPLTLAMRRGDLSRIARANGFITDSTDIATIGQRPGDTTVVRRGEGWQLLSGRASTSVLLASVRAPNGCYLLWAGRGVDISIDTLGLVLGTVRFGVPDTVRR